MPYKIILADDHVVVREGVRGLIQARMSEVEIVAEASSGRETLALCQQHQPDLLLLDLSMPDLGGLEVLADLKRISPATKVAILSQYTDRGYVIRALKLGARGYVPKKAVARELVAAMRAVLDGRTYLDPSVADYVVQAALDPDGSHGASELDLLTEREVQVLKLSAEGETAKQVAQTLGVSVHTVNRHRANLMEKLGLHSKVELVKLALRLQLVEL
jgi:DNA-binding NarL/FixJ family response regulator